MIWQKDTFPLGAPIRQCFAQEVIQMYNQSEHPKYVPTRSLLVPPEQPQALLENIPTSRLQLCNT